MKNDWINLANALASELEYAAQDLRSCIDEGNQSFQRLCCADFDGLGPADAYEMLMCSECELDMLDLARDFDKTWTEACSKVREFDREITTLIHKLQLLSTMSRGGCE